MLFQFHFLHQDLYTIIKKSLFQQEQIAIFFGYDAYELVHDYDDQHRWLLMTNDYKWVQCDDHDFNTSNDI